MTGKKIKKIIISVFIFVIINFLTIYSGANPKSKASKTDNANEKIIGKWVMEENIQKILSTTNITFKQNSRFIYVVEEAMDDKKASSMSEGTYTISGNKITMHYESFDGRALPEEDKQVETVDIYMFDSMLGFPGYEIKKDKNTVFVTNFQSYSVNSKLQLVTKETINETITINDTEKTVLLIDKITKEQKINGKDKNIEVNLEKTGGIEHNKDGSIKLNFTKSSLDKSTSVENPEIKNIRIFKKGNYALINPFVKVKQ